MNRLIPSIEAYSFGAWAREPWPSPVDTHGNLRYSSKAKAGIVPRLEQVLQQELVLRQVELELRGPLLLEPCGRVERLRERLDHRGVGLRRRDDVLPDPIDRGPLVLVDQRAEGLDQPPHGGADPNR